MQLNPTFHPSICATAIGHPLCARLCGRNRGSPSPRQGGAYSLGWGTGHKYKHKLENVPPIGDI